MSEGYLSGPDYATVIRCTPILCVDIVLQTEATPTKYVLFRRNNEPLKGEWWIVGGRVNKGEMILNACQRKLFEETRLARGIGEFRFLGHYEEVFNFSSIGRGPYHTVSLVYQLYIDPNDIKLDEQHSEWKLSDGLPHTLTTLVGEAK